MTMHIREQDAYDTLPDPNDMTLAESIIAERISDNADEINTINDVCKMMIQHYLRRCGLVTTAADISIVISVFQSEETISPINYPAEPISAATMQPHILLSDPSLETEAEESMDMLRLWKDKHGRGTLLLSLNNVGNGRNYRVSRI